MFSVILDAGFINRVETDAMVKIKEDRQRYDLVYKTIEEYATKHGVLISNKYKLVPDGEFRNEWLTKTYSLYSTNPFLHANDLVNAIHKATADRPDSEMTRLKTVTEQEEFSIEYDTRILVNMYKLQKGKSDNQIVKPVELGGLMYMPAELELVDLYHDLYLMKDTDENLAIEPLLVKQVEERREAGLLGGDCKENKKIFIENAKLLIVRDLFAAGSSGSGETNEKAVILIGAWAYDLLRLGYSGLCTNVEKIQIVSGIDPNELLRVLSKFINDLSPSKITFREQELHIPKDFRTARFTYYIKAGGSEKAFLDLFNCPAFELVPCLAAHTSANKKTTLLVGHPWVILRFLYIDLWVARIIKALGLLPEEVLKKKINYGLLLIDYFRAADKSFENVKFVGIHREAQIDKKNDMLSQEKRYFPYYPALYKSERGGYRSVR